MKQCRHKAGMNSVEPQTNPRKKQHLPDEFWTAPLYPRSIPGEANSVARDSLSLFIYMTGILTDRESLYMNTWQTHLATLHGSCFRLPSVPVRREGRNTTDFNSLRPLLLGHEYYITHLAYIKLYWNLWLWAIHPLNHQTNYGHAALSV